MSAHVGANISVASAIHAPYPPIVMLSHSFTLPTWRQVAQAGIYACDPVGMSSNRPEFQAKKGTQGG